MTTMHQPMSYATASDTRYPMREIVQGLWKVDRGVEMGFRRFLLVSVRLPGLADDGTAPPNALWGLGVLSEPCGKPAVGLCAWPVTVG